MKKVFGEYITAKKIENIVREIFIVVHPYNLSEQQRQPKKSMNKQK